MSVGIYKVWLSYAGLAEVAERRADDARESRCLPENVEASATVEHGGATNRLGRQPAVPRASVLPGAVQHQAEEFVQHFDGVQYVQFRGKSHKNR